MVPRWLSGIVSAYQTEDAGSIPGLGRSPEVGNDNPLQYSCLENSMDRGASRGDSPWSCKELDMTEHAVHTPSQSTLMKV